MNDPVLYATPFAFFGPLALELALRYLAIKKRNPSLNLGNRFFKMLNAKLTDKHGIQSTALALKNTIK